MSVIGGVLLAAPSADVEAAALDTNLVPNPGFELVDLGSPGPYGSVRVLSWAGGPGFAYSAFNGYANGGPLAGGGSYYFTPNASSPDITGPGQFYQDLDVSTGASAAAIAAGLAEYHVSAFMTGYLNDGDFGSVHVAFRNGLGETLGTALISDDNPLTWTLESASGPIPVGTTSVRLSVYGTAVTGGADGFVDNVSFSISELPPPVPVVPTSLRSIGAALSGLGMTAVLFRLLRRRRGVG